MLNSCPSAPLPLPLPLPLTFSVVGWSMALQLLVGGGLATLPLVFPPIVFGYGLLLLLGRQGWLAQWLPDALRPNIVFTQTGLVAAAFIAGLPLMAKPAQAAFAGVPPRLREAAATLGHGPWSVFWRVDLPLARRGVAAGLILAGGCGLGEVGLSLMLGGNIARRTETLSLAIYNHVRDGNLVCANTLSL